MNSIMPVQLGIVYKVRRLLEDCVLELLISIGNVIREGETVGVKYQSH